MPLLLLLLHLTLSMRNRHCFVTATTNALAHLILLLPGHLHLAMALTLALATEIRSSNRLAGSAAMDTCSAIIAVTGPSSVPFAVSRWGRADVACCRINYSRCSPRISPAMEVSTREGFAFNGQQTGASFRLLPPFPPHGCLSSRCNDPNWERQVINMSSVRQLLAVQTFGISASNLPKMAPKLALSLGACPSSGRRLLPLPLPLTLTLPLHTGGD